MTVRFTPRLRRASLLAACAAALTLAACEDRAAPSEEVDLTPIIELQAVARYELPVTVRDLAALPDATSPFRGLIVAVTDDGAGQLISLSENRVIEAPGLQGNDVDVAADFALRGQTAPLILAAGGPGDGFAAFLTIETGDTLTRELAIAPAPMDDVPVDFIPTRVCVIRVGSGIVDARIGDDAGQTAFVRVQDTGAEALSVSVLDEATGPVDACETRTSKGRAVLVDISTVREAQRLVTAQQNAEDAGATLPGLTETQEAADALPDPFPKVPDIVRIATLAEEGVLTVSEPEFDGEALAQIRIVASFSGEMVLTPRALTASPANYGGTFNAGFIAVADGRDVTLLALDFAMQRVSEVQDLPSLP